MEKRGKRVVDILVGYVRIKLSIKTMAGYGRRGFKYENYQSKRLR